MTEVADGRAREDEDMGAMAARLARIEEPLLASVEAGNFPAIAAQAQGVAARTWARWKSRADAGEALFVEFFEKVNCALAKAEQGLVKILRTPPMTADGKADQGWIRSTQFLLERTRRERWGDKVEVRVKVEDSMRELLGELEQRMSQEAFDEFVVALAEIETDHGAGEG